MHVQNNVALTENCLPIPGVVLAGYCVVLEFVDPHLLRANACWPRLCLAFNQRSLSACLLESLFSHAV